MYFRRVPMKILTIIGNGFDLGHCLPTQFNNFVKSNSKFYREYDIFRDDNNSWNDIERRYGQLLLQKISERSWLDVTEEVGRIISEYGFNDYGEVDYYNYEFEAWNNELNKTAQFIDLLDQFEHDFHAYLKTACCDEVILDKQSYQPISEILHQSDTIISFNYTHTTQIFMQVI